MDKHCIVIADDDPTTLKILNQALKSLDCEIIAANNGQEALQLIVDHQPSLIISDWHMPVLDGVSLFLQVKNSPYTNHIPFVFLTTTDDVEVRIALLEIGVEDYWHKPFNVREIAVRAKKLLERLGTPQQARRPNLTSLENNQASEQEHTTLNNRYKLLELIGEGGMGRVYKAMDLIEDKVIALKLLRSEYIHDETEVRRFAREAAASMRIKHENVIKTYEYGLIPSGQAYITMEVLKGYPLSDRISSGHILPLSWTLPIIYQVCLAVAEAHRQGVIHRDLKPTNIFILDTATPLPVVKVLDFGIALIAANKAATASDDRLTNPNVIVGTPQYLSPEQIKGTEVDTRSDIYMLGILFYELLTSEVPFNGSSLEILLSHVNQMPTPIQQLVPIDTWLASLVMKMLEKDPANRPQSMEEILAILGPKVAK